MLNNTYIIPQDSNQNKFTNYDCYRVTDINNERFYQIPKSLFSTHFQNLSLEAKIIYAFLKDRMELSRKNNWIDENGYIYLIFAQTEIAKLLNVSKATISRAIKSLKEYELILVVRQGLNRPSKIYICKIKNSQ